MRRCGWTTDVDEQNWDIDQFAETDGSVRRFDFCERRVRGRVVLRRKELTSLELFGHPNDHIVVLGVDQGRDLVLASFEEDVKDLDVGELEGLVGHINLQRGDTGGAEGRKFAEGQGCGVANEEMEGVVTVAGVLSFGVSG